MDIPEHIFNCYMVAVSLSAVKNYFESTLMVQKRIIETDLKEVTLNPFVSIFLQKKCIDIEHVMCNA